MENQPPLIELREVYEAQDRVQLQGMLGFHAMKISHHNEHIEMIQDVLGGLGVPEANMAAYDANDGTTGSPEHPEDNKWR